MPKRMLIVEDEKNILDLLLTIFGDLNEYQVLCAEDGQEALKISQSGNLDIILLDINLPKLSGYSLCRLIKRDPAKNHVKILMLSGMAQKYDCLKAKEVGADAYFTKPFNAEELMEAVKTLASAD